MIFSFNETHVDKPQQWQV